MAENRKRKRNRAVRIPASVFGLALCLTACYYDRPPKEIETPPSVTDEQDEGSWWLEGKYVCAHGSLIFCDGNHKKFSMECDDALAEAIGITEGGSYSGTYSIYEIVQPGGHLDAKITKASNIGLYFDHIQEDETDETVIGDIPLLRGESDADTIRTMLTIDGVDMVFTKESK